MAKTVMFQVRITPEDYARLQAVAGEEYLGVAPWVRRAVLRALTRAETDSKTGRDNETHDGPSPPSDRLPLDR